MPKPVSRALPAATLITVAAALAACASMGEGKMNGPAQTEQNPAQQQHY